MTTFNVILNSLDREIVNDKGITLEFKGSELKTYTSLDDAKAFRKSYRPGLKKHDTLYIYRHTPGSKGFPAVRSGIEPASESAVFFMDAKRYGVIV